MRKVLGSSVFPFVFFGLIITALILQFYLHIRKTHLETEKRNSQRRVESIERRIEEFVVSSKLVSQFVFEDMRNLDSFDKVNIEKKLTQFLQASPSELIYGIGVWFHPSQFQAGQKYFGPYARRSKDGIELTYEWDTEDYDYPNQAWYQAGYQSPAESVFVDPYFDTDLVYVTNARPLKNKKGKTIGVITVDLVIPQLNQLIEKYNYDQRSLLYIENRLGQLLAHPLSAEFLNQKKDSNQSPITSLLDFKASDIHETLGLQFSPQYKKTIQNKSLGWNVVTENSDAYIFEKLSSIQNALLVSILILWLLIGLILKIVADRKKEFKKNQHEIDMARAQLAQTAKMAALGEMAGSVAHEINNPLAIITAHAHNLQKAVKEPAPPIEKIQNHTDKILKTVDRITSIIKGLKSFARSGERDPFHAESLAEIISETISFCEQRFRQAGIVIKMLSFSDSMIWCRKSQISQVLLNLLSNSADAIETLDDKWVQIEVLTADNKVQIVITDSGNGIPADVVEKMMQPFFTTKEVGKGTGLGLSISKGIIDDQKGQLIYNSKSSNTQFIIILPIHLNKDQDS